MCKHEINEHSGRCKKCGADLDLRGDILGIIAILSVLPILFLISEFCKWLK